jgi:hypothetical protein
MKNTSYTFKARNITFIGNVRFVAQSNICITSWNRQSHFVKAPLPWQQRFDRIPINYASIKVPENAGFGTESAVFPP